MCTLFLFHHKQVAWMAAADIEFLGHRLGDDLIDLLFEVLKSCPSVRPYVHKKFFPIFM